MLLTVLHYASICSYASTKLLCSKLCQHNSPRPTDSVIEFLPRESLSLRLTDRFRYPKQPSRTVHLATRMATYGTISEFRQDTEELDTYLERVELYFTANEILDGKQVYTNFPKCCGEYNVQPAP